MKFGVCAPLEKMDLLAEVGYNYIELGVQSALIPEKNELWFGIVGVGAWFENRDGQKHQFCSYP